MRKGNEESMPPGDAFHTQAQIISLCRHSKTGRFKGLGSEASPGSAASTERLWPHLPSLGFSLLARHKGFAKASGTYHEQASTDIRRDSNKGCAKKCFQGRLASSSAQSFSAPQLRARNPSNKQHLSTARQSQLPTLLKYFQHIIFLLPGDTQSGE